MKTTFYILLIAISGLAISCDKNDDTPKDDPEGANISGTWNLRNIHGGFAGINTDYEPGVITWTFNDETSTLTVENNHPSGTEVYDGLETGTYPYSVTAQGYLMIDGGDYIYTASENELTIEENMTDGYIFYFKR